MQWLTELAATQPVAHAVLVLGLIAIAGLALSGVRVRGVGLGIAGVLFAGILFGHLGVRIAGDILEFARDFGLILFVFTIGMQLGPGFFASLRRQGLKLNLLAAAVVLLGAAGTVLAAWLGGIDIVAAMGLFAGASSNTPSLGAAQQTLKTLPDLTPDRAALPALAYAVSYPMAVLGIIGTLLLLRALFRIDAPREAEAFRAEQRQGIESLERLNVLVDNPALHNRRLADLPGRREMPVIVSRLKRAGAAEPELVTEDTVLHTGDIVLAVGTPTHLEQFRALVGRESEVDLAQIPGRVRPRRVVVTRKNVLGKTLRELALNHLYGVTVTRVTRADLELTAIPNVELQFGDMLMVVGQEESLDKVAEALGNSVRALNETKLIPIFIGIVLGVLAGSAPLRFGAMPAPVRLGLAGGPLLLALVLSRIGRIGPLLWHMPVNVNTAFRELGLTLFLACVGLKAGEHFFATVFTAQGLRWLLAGTAVTVLPILAVGVVARAGLRLNFMNICGLLAGSMTDPPALAFAASISKSDAPSVAYATVYPLTVLLRILTVQGLVLTLCR
jgi:putative transport protein